MKIHENEETKPTPKPGDGTQPARPKPEVNWYGTSHKPQEEFIDNVPPSRESAQPPKDGDTEIAN